MPCAPVIISQHNCLAALGLERQRFLDELKGYRAAGGVVTERGQLRLVVATDFLRYLVPEGKPRPVAKTAEDRLRQRVGLEMKGGKP